MTAHLVQEGVDNAFEMFPRLKERRSQIAGTLSGGEQQMLAMGRALMTKPRILLLDEPSMGLAPILVEDIFETIQRIHAEGAAILLVEQNAATALTIAHRGYVLQTGRIILADSAAGLASNEDVRRSYLGEGPVRSPAARLHEAHRLGPSVWLFGLALEHPALQRDGSGSLRVDPDRSTHQGDGLGRTMFQDDTQAAGEVAMERLAHQGRRHWRLGGSLRAGATRSRGGVASWSLPTTG